VKSTLREVLADSHVPAFAVAVLLLWSLDAGFKALWIPLSPAATVLLTAVAIFDIPYFSPKLTLADRFILITTFSYLWGSLICFAAAWLLSRWVYGVGPLRTLSAYRSRLTRRGDV
jgi:hypothetical protein